MKRKSTLTERYALDSSADAAKRIVLRFLASPVAMHGDERVKSVEFVHNEIRQSPDGTIRAHPTSSTEVIETGLVLRSIGYRGTPVPGVPFDADRGIIPNHDGRVLDPRTNEPLTGTYVTGWIKRGPSGVIGTNKKCAHETVSQLLTDFTAGRLSRPHNGHDELAELVGQRQPDRVDFAGWKMIDAAERAQGRRQGRPRAKFTDVASMLEAIRERQTATT